MQLMQEKNIQNKETLATDITDDGNNRNDISNQSEETPIDDNKDENNEINDQIDDISTPNFIIVSFNNNHICNKALKLLDGEIIGENQLNVIRFNNRFVKRISIPHKR